MINVPAIEFHNTCSSLTSLYSSYVYRQMQAQHYVHMCKATALRTTI